MIMYRCGGGGSSVDVNSFFVESGGVQYPPVIGLFSHTNFNAPVNIGDNVAYCAEMFRFANNFNSPVKFGANVKNIKNMFSHAPLFNQPVTIPEGVTDCQSLFSGSTSFNQPVDIPDSVTSCRQMFYNAIALNSPMTFGRNVMTCYSIFDYCRDFSANLYFKGDTYRNLNIALMGLYWQNTHRHNIHFNAALNNVFNRQNYSVGSITGGDIYWSTYDANCFYNAYYNIYCYNNYAG